MTLDEPKRSDTGGIADALRRYVDAVVDATEATRERAERIVDELAKRGQLRAKDIQQAASELAERSARERDELFRLVQKEFRRQVDSRRKGTEVDPAGPSDVRDGP
jgi:polyhydroxyalkanoate synthesis regulator phasin